MRQTLKRIIAASADLDLVGLARDGEDAVSKARELRPDVISMDINMPKLDGITALQMILQEKICPVVMVSSLTQRGTTTTFECLELGAFDFVAKPDGTVSSNLGAVADELISKLKAAACRGIVTACSAPRAPAAIPGRHPRDVREHRPEEGDSHRNFHRRASDPARGAAADSRGFARQHFPGAAHATLLYRLLCQAP
jgi:chemotaxis response regulator CheB